MAGLVVAVILVVFASIGVVIAVFVKNRGPEFENFFQKFKKAISFQLLADSFTFTVSQRFKFDKYVVLLQISCPRLCKINFKEEAILVGHPVQSNFEFHMNKHFLSLNCLHYSGIAH